MDRVRDAWNRSVRRLAPPTMAARLVLTASLIAITTTIVTLSINAALVNARAEAWTRSDVIATFKGFHSFLALESGDLDRSIAIIAGEATFRSLDASADAASLQRDYGDRLAAEAGDGAAVCVSSDGRVLVSAGSPSDVRTLRKLAMADPSRETTGLARLSAGIALLSGRPIIEDGGPRPVGYLLVARPLDDATLGRFDSLQRTLRTTLREPGYRPTGGTLRSVSAAEGTVVYGTVGTEVVAVADLPSVADGPPIATVVLRDLEPRGTRASSVATESAILAGVAAALIGIGLGLWLAGIMRRPVARMIRQTARRAQAAAHNEPFDQPLARDPVLPVEFQELASVIESLIRNLDARRAELERAVHEAEYAEETLGVVVDESREAKLVLQDDRVVIANPAATAAAGAPISDLIGHSATAALSRARIATEEGSELSGAELVERALEQPASVSLTLSDGTERWYVVDAVRHADAQRERVLLTARDVTEERRIASIRAEIIALVGHDLRSPLTVVMGYLDLMQRPMTEAERARAIDAARRNAARMADLLEDLLTATRAEELLAPSDLVPTSLSALAEEVVASLGPTHSERMLLLDQDCDPIVLGEEKRLRQVLVNLVTNAYKYSPDPEPIVVRIRCDEKTAYLEVVDHGPGIPVEDREHVFERFARLHAGPGRAGVGLGLYIVNIIVTNHGGSVHIEGTPGGGATFVVELPLVGTMIDGEFVL